MIHGLVLYGVHLVCLAHLEHKVRGQTENGRDDEGEEYRLPGMCEQKIGAAAIRMSVD